MTAPPRPHAPPMQWGMIKLLFCACACAAAAHSSEKRSLSVPWILTLSCDQGYLKNQFKTCLRKFPGADFEIFLIQNFMQIFEIYLMPRFLTMFDPIFRISGIFQDLCYPLLDWKVHISCLKIGSKLQFLMCLEKWRKQALRGLKSQNMYISFIKYDSVKNFRPKKLKCHPGICKKSTLRAR